ncbi:PH domain-containing protein [Nesterenkonia alba]|uniref:PH domain-containing protein n=1 Tax=Nesterenkonia alba TaxID=515814 RepID=UPI0003B5DAC3|nr:PH domain-containing protein [Nesterenkonia alba]
MHNPYAPQPGEEPEEPTEPPPQQPQDGERWFDPTWTRVHPLSPIVQGWLTFIGIPAVVLGYNWELWVDIFHAVRTGEVIEDARRNPELYIIGSGIVLLIATLIFAGAFLSWWFTRYKVTEEHVMVKSGVLFRQHRQARIDRVQAVDLRQPLLARITGLAELKFEVAEGDGTAVTLSFLRRWEAEQLRGEIMDRAAGRRQYTADDAGTTTPGHPPGHEWSPQSPPAPEEAGHPPPAHAPGTYPTPGAPPGTGQLPGTAGAAAPAAGESPAVTPQPERFIAKVPTGRLLGSIILGPLIMGIVGITVVLIVIATITVTIVALTDSETDTTDVLSIFLASLGLAPFLVPVAIGLAFGVWSQINNSYGFTATMTEAGLRLRYGLTTTNTQTVPPGRVQAVEVSQPLFWRPFGWFRMTVTVAGYGLDARSQLLPVGTRSDVMAIAAEMFPDLKIPNPEEQFTHGLTGRDTDLGFTRVPSRARVFDPLVARRRGFFVTPSVLMIRDGFTTRRLSMVPHERIQSLSIHQGPFARMTRIATCWVHLPSGPVNTRVKNQDVEAIRELFARLADHAAVARRLTDRNQWMLPEELAEFEKMVEEVRKTQDIPTGTGISAADSPAQPPVQGALRQREQR